MVNPGAFLGTRKEFLKGLKPYYAAAVEEGSVAEALSIIQRRYLIRYPIELPHDVEPSDEHLASVDDDAAVAEVEGPNMDLLTLEEYEAALSKWEDRQKLILFRKAQIQRWFSYQFMKDNDLDSTQSGLFNPYRSLLTTLTGKKINAPRQRSAANVWRKTQRELIEAEVQARLAAQEKETGDKMKKENLIAFRDTVARNLFKHLTKEEQRSWQLAAIAEHHAATREWKAEMEGKPKQDPQSRQVAIQGLVKFVQPILDLICEATGWKASLICGGPEPAQGGLLNVVSIHSGATSGDVKMTFGRTEREQFRKVVVPLYGSFLQKCYTPVECRSRALRVDQGFLPLVELDLDNEGASVDAITPSSAHPPPIWLGPPPIPTHGASKAQRSKTTARAAPAAPARTPAAPAPAPAARTPAAPAPAPAAPAPAPAARTPAAPAPAPAAPAPAARTPAAPAPSAPAPAPTTPRVPTHSPPPYLSSSVPQLPPSYSVHGLGVPCSQIAVDETEASNPFPIEILESPQPTTHASRGDLSHPATPQPSPCASPTPQRVLLPPPSAFTQPEDSASSTADDSASSIAEDSASSTAAVEEAERGPLSASTMATLEARNDVTPLRRSTRGLKANDKANLVGKGGTKRQLDESQAAGNPSAVDQRAKRQRTAAQPTDTFIPPDNAPKWFKNAFQMLSKDLGEEWRSMVVSWGRFELEAGFNDDSRLRTEGRPVAIRDWIQRARSLTWRPRIPVPDTFGLEVKGWWLRLQPKWRIEKDGTLRKGLDGDYEELMRPGINGLLGVAAALLYWGEALQSSQAGNEEWLEVVLDFQLILSKLT